MNTRLTNSWEDVEDKCPLSSAPSRPTPRCANPLLSMYSPRRHPPHVCRCCCPFLLHLSYLMDQDGRRSQGMCYGHRSRVKMRKLQAGQDAPLPCEHEHHAQHALRSTPHGVSEERSSRRLASAEPTIATRARTPRGWHLRCATTPRLRCSKHGAAIQYCGLLPS